MKSPSKGVQTEIVIGDLKVPHNPERQAVKNLCLGLSNVGVGMDVFIHSFNEYLLRACCMPDTSKFRG